MNLVFCKRWTRDNVYFESYVLEASRCVDRGQYYIIVSYSILTESNGKHTQCELVHIFNKWIAKLTRSSRILTVFISPPRHPGDNLSPETPVIGRDRRSPENENCVGLARFQEKQRPNYSSIYLCASQPQEKNAPIDLHQLNDETDLKSRPYIRIR